MSAGVTLEFDQNFPLKEFEPDLLPSFLGRVRVACSATEQRGASEWVARCHSSEPFASGSPHRGFGSRDTLKPVSDSIDVM